MGAILKQQGFFLVYYRVIIGSLETIRLKKFQDIFKVPLFHVRMKAKVDCKIIYHKNSFLDF